MILLTISIISLLTGFGIGKFLTNKKMNMLLSEEPRIGVFTTRIILGKGSTSKNLTVKVEVKEIAKGAKKSKIEYTSFHVTPLEYNTPERWKHIGDYLGPWVEPNKVEWYVEYDTRKRRISRLLGK